MQPIYLLLLALATAISAQTTTVQVFNAGETTIPLSGVEASVVGANAIATTFAMQCKDNAPTSLCDLDDPVTITAGPSTMTFSAVYTTKTLGVNVKLTLMNDCDVTSSTAASCSGSAGIYGSTLGVSRSSSTTWKTSYSSDDIYYQPLTVTAGVDKLNAPQATQTPDAAAAGHVGVGGAAAAAVAAAAYGFI
ncbi:hypothetical protein ASPWEDRAFT_28422 [Aspergillus wentii DTO 134E9]|uniref:GPI anchored cell wall protein n=1 Tax=Aspergillus wentii DTO 134E9 TaxID=1073089 RepID=A0A1L9RLP2_ASPWE|nr:uncharacterized protein ASPWEDRAFT_28422 [Aspergillus wentii DTO 134E9]KAI9929728.1 hypothetical protein MW887_001204 [Aspergillus wentii]OJJ35814.1 hypothetical protein ASPWEDRAFT_28422 [Aspergillus wentii DTO 134E9]